MEKKKKGDDDWSECTQVPATATNVTVKGLVEGEEYQFCVRAENAAGPGEPSKPSKSVVAADQPGELSLIPGAPPVSVSPVWICVVRHGLKKVFCGPSLIFLLQICVVRHGLKKVFLWSFSDLPAADLCSQAWFEEGFSVDLL